jgi:hypothetical protein
VTFHRLCNTQQAKTAPYSSYTTQNTILIDMRAFAAIALTATVLASGANAAIALGHNGVDHRS